MKLHQPNMAFERELAQMNFKAEHVQASQSPEPLGVEVAFITDNARTAHERALTAGAVELASPVSKPWGQVVSYVRCPDGTLVELCTPVSP